MKVMDVGMQNSFLYLRVLKIINNYLKKTMYKLLRIVTLTTRL